jgi:hypothetical protein
VLSAAGNFSMVMPSEKLNLANGLSINPAAGTLLAMALPEVTVAQQVAKADPIGQLMAAIYGEIPTLGTGTVVPVGASAMLANEPRTSFFIAHINVAATFGDALSSFIDDCTAMSPAPLAEGQTPASHARAWMVTLGVVALDGVILHYLISRRRRTVNPLGDFDWC